MVTKNPRLNVVLEPKLYAGISKLARKQGISMSLLARDLLKESVERYEDYYWQQVAQQREKTFSLSKALSHKNVWK